MTSPWVISEADAAAREAQLVDELEAALRRYTVKGTPPDIAYKMLLRDGDIEPLLCKLLFKFLAKRRGASP